jgi:hypothetical protein
LAAAGVAAPAFAQTWIDPQPYVNLGYTYLNPHDRDLGEITGRLGMQMGTYWGVEGEVGSGLFSNKFTDGAGDHVKLGEGIDAAGYLVGFLPLPVMNNRFQLLARVGYGETPLELKTPEGSTLNTSHSINVGAGVQYMMDGHNGLRFDWTRRDFQEHNAPTDDDTYAVAYVHRF